MPSKSDNCDSKFFITDNVCGSNKLFFGVNVAIKKSELPNVLPTSL